MFLKRPETESKTLRKAGSFLAGLSFPKKIGLGVIVLALYTFGMYSWGVMAVLESNPAMEEEKPSSSAPQNVYNPSLSVPERIEIRISEKDFGKIVRERKTALENGIIVTTSDSYVPAKIRHKGEVYPAKMRIKGDWPEHLHGKKWSYRISIKDNLALLGMREFSIQHPARRNYIYGWLFQSVLKQEDIIALRIKFVDVVMNGQELGIYYLEEHFDKVLIENNRRREGPIIKFDEDILWKNRRRKFGATESETAFYSSPITGFQPGKLSKDPLQKQLFEQAVQLLDGFRRGELKTSEVFDIDRLARYYALSDLFGAYHMAFFHNLRFYFNPVSLKLEPVAFDADAGNFIHEVLASNRFPKNAYRDLDRLLFEDDAFMGQYLRELNRVSRPQYLAHLRSRLANETKQNLNLIYKDYPSFHMIKENLIYNQQFILHALKPIKGLHAYVQGVGGKDVTLRMGTVQTLPLTVEGIAWKGKIVYRPAEEFVLPGKDPRRPVEYTDVAFRSVVPLTLNAQQWKKAKVVYRVMATDYKNESAVFPWPGFDSAWAQAALLRKTPNDQDVGFVLKNEERKIILIQPGSWTLNKALILPAGYTVAVQAGAEIDLTAGAKIISFSPVVMKGTVDNPVRLFSSDGSGQGLAVIQAEGTSLLEHVVFEGLSACRHEGWELTGTVTFYESMVQIRDSQFLGNHQGDDQLNIVRSDFLVEKVEFGKSFADALDVDFSNGQIQSCRFTKSGNDAMDFSGSTVEVKQVAIVGAMDKGLSVGEGSQVEGEGITISDSNLALVSKDESFLNVINVTLTNCRVGLAAYQKKPEFGPATLKIKNLTHSNVKSLALQQPGSKIKMQE